MHQAWKNVLLALFALNTLFAFLQPSTLAFASVGKLTEATASELVQGQSEAVAKIDQGYQLPAEVLEAKSTECAFPHTTLTVVDKLAPEATISSFQASKNILQNMISNDYLLVKKESASYATPKTVLGDAISESTLSSLSKSEQTTVEQGEINGQPVVASAYGLNADILLNLVNQHRTSIGLTALVKDDRLMQIAAGRAPQLFDEIFVNHNMHAGFYALHLPFYATENIIYYHDEEGALQWWLHSPVHRAAIENPTHTVTGIACSGRFCSMIFSSLQSKDIDAAK